MVTFSFMTIFALMAALAALFDMKILNYTFWEALWNLLFTEIATGRMILVATLLAGLVSSLITDFRILKARKKSGSS
ncbi:hypothetical protein [Bacillus sp. J33]|uniref:hypothetical protein n=1 Tax=Bacillus sp. J33 TaxID=935836 RepID=UPI00047C13CC|nr:hypothetical protein [Bacillus sp. J33]